MKTPRVTITHLAVLVAIVAVNLTVGRALWEFRSGFLLGVSVIGPVLQVGLFRLYRTSGLPRAFWFGFVVVGSGAIFTLYWAVSHSPETICFKVWESYAEMAEVGLEHLPYSNIILSENQLGVLGFSPYHITVVVVLSLPLLIVALVGGILARQIAKWRGIRSVEGPLPLSESQHAL